MPPSPPAPKNASIVTSRLPGKICAANEGSRGGHQPGALGVPLLGGGQAHDGHGVDELEAVQPGRGFAQALQEREPVAQLSEVLRGGAKRSSPEEVEERKRVRGEFKLHARCQHGRVLLVYTSPARNLACDRLNGERRRCEMARDTIPAAHQLHARRVSRPLFPSQNGEQPCCSCGGSYNSCDDASLEAHLLARREMLPTAEIVVQTTVSVI